MLSRTALHVFWMARYMERIDYVARLIDVAARMSALAGAGVSTGDEWRSALAAAGCDETFERRFGEPDRDKVVDYLVLDAANPSSIASAVELARQNARSERTALTADAWTAVNETWLNRANLRVGDGDLTDVIDWVKSRSVMFRGAYTSTMLRSDTYFFLRLGTFIERADNTARLLDVKYHVLLPSHETVGGGLDYYQWSSILRAASALRAYHWVFADRVRPAQVAELLILRREMPRSIRACYDEIVSALDALADGYGGRRGECHRLAGAAHARLRYATIEEVFDRGLHEFLEDTNRQTAAIGSAVAQFYMT